MTRFNLLRTNGRFLCPLAFSTRKHFYIKPQVGYFNDIPEQANPLDAMLKQDPNDLFGMMKVQIPFLLLQLALGFLINSFFSGYLVAKIPFPLTYKFKSTLQMGMFIELLDMKFVSSLSWYFLVMFGSSGLISLIDFVVLREKEKPLNSALEAMMPGQNPLARQQLQMNAASTDLKKMYEKHKEELETMNYQFLLENIEYKLIKG